MEVPVTAKNVTTLSEVRQITSGILGFIALVSSNRKFCVFSRNATVSSIRLQVYFLAGLTSARHLDDPGSNCGRSVRLSL